MLTSTFHIVVKLQYYVQTLVLELGVDFVFPLSQKQQEQQQEEEPLPKFIRRGVLEVLNLTYKLLMGFWLN